MWSIMYSPWVKNGACACVFELKLTAGHSWSPTANRQAVNLEVNIKI